MDVQVKVWCGAGIQPSMVSQMDQRERELTNPHLAMTHGSPAILLTHSGLPDKQLSLCWGCVSSSEFKNSSAPLESPDSGLNHSEPDNMEGSSWKAQSIFLVQKDSER